MRRIRHLSCVVIAAGLLTALPREAVAQSDYDFESGAQGWFARPAPAPEGHLWTDTAARSGEHSLRTEGAAWVSPGIDNASYDYLAMRAFVATDTEVVVRLREGVRFVTLPDTDGEWVPVSLGYRGGDWSDWGGSVPLHFQVETSPGEVGYVDDVTTMGPVTAIEMAAILDENYDQMGRYDFGQFMRADRHENIQATMSKLASGQDVKAVMLGDSIVADTYRSLWETLVTANSPGSIDSRAAVRGSTGCWWYKDADPETGIPRMQSYVFDHNPDLVMIGGISHQKDIEAVREVIGQIEDHDPAIEILLMTGLAGYDDHNVDSTVLAPVDPNGTGWRSQLYRLAVEEEVGFLDMTQPWFSYVNASGDELSDYKRDSIHNNYYGCQIAGRTLEAYFAIPEPSAMLILGLGAVALRLRRRN